MTISDIAKMAGVSSAAVSRYFNNGYLSDEKKEAIRRVVEVTGYRPSIQAQMLRTKKTKTIGVLIPRIDSTSMSRVVGGIMDILDASGYRMILGTTRNDTHKELEYLNVFNENQVDGIIMAGTIFSATHRKAMKKVTVPLVVVGQEIAGFNCIFHDDYHAEYDLTKTFLDKGSRNFGYIGVTEKDRAVGELRYKGFCDALKDAGLPEQRSNYVVAEFSRESSYEKMGELYAAHPELDTVICATDRLALGAYLWMRDHGIDNPGQIQIAGQGDSETSAVCNPPITTIRYFYKESGEAAARRIIELIEEDDEHLKNITREVQLGFEIVDHIKAR